jgi:hypothetical protein
MTEKWPREDRGLRPPLGHLRDLFCCTPLPPRLLPDNLGRQGSHVEGKTATRDLSKRQNDIKTVTIVSRQLPRTNILRDILAARNMMQKFKASLHIETLPSQKPTPSFLIKFTFRSESATRQVFFSIQNLFCLFTPQREYTRSKQRIPVYFKNKSYYFERFS